MYEIKTSDQFVHINRKVQYSLSKFWQMRNLIRDSFQVSQDYMPETCVYDFIAVKYTSLILFY